MWRPFSRLSRGRERCTEHGLIDPSLLNDPNNASPANVEAANLHNENRREYVRRVKRTVEKSWECA